jgi:hypothetical protein
MDFWVDFHRHLFHGWEMKHVDSHDYSRVFTLHTLRGERTPLTLMSGLRNSGVTKRDTQLYKICSF